MIVEVSNLTKEFGAKRAVDAISFSLHEGEVLGLLGLNGAGKSTTMNMVTGCISPSSGNIRISGHDIIDEPKEAKRLLGYVPEVLAFYPEMRVDEYLEFVCALKGAGRRGRAELPKLCERAGIAHVKKRLIRNLSKGYRQRVGLCQAMIGSPRLLVLDEPTVGLDPSQVVEIRSLIKELGKQNTVILSSHILSEIQEICSRVIILHQGRLITDSKIENMGLGSKNVFTLELCVEGEPTVVLDVLHKVSGVQQAVLLLEKEHGSYAYEIHCSAGMDVRRELFFALADAGLPMLPAWKSGLSLENIFLNLTTGENLGVDKHDGNI